MNLFGAIVFGALITFFGDTTGQAISLSPDYPRPPQLHHHPQIQARLPPTLNNTRTSPSWTPPPPGWFTGNWKVTHSSIPVYLTLLNIQFDSAPLPSSNTTLPGQNSDLTSYQQPTNNSRIFTAYGIDTPHPNMVDVFDFAGTGKLTGVNNTWELLAWGEDTCGEGYMLIYETAVAASGSPAGLDIESRVEGGPSAETLKAILSAVRRLGGGELRRLAGEVKKVPENGARRGQLPVVCDEGCRENVDQ